MMIDPCTPRDIVRKNIKAIGERGSLVLQRESYLLGFITAILKNECWLRSSVRFESGVVKNKYEIPTGCMVYIFYESGKCEGDIPFLVIVEGGYSYIVLCSKEICSTII